MLQGSVGFEGVGTGGGLALGGAWAGGMLGVEAVGGDLAGGAHTEEIAGWGLESEIEGCKWLRGLREDFEISAEGVTGRRPIGKRSGFWEGSISFSDGPF